MSEKIFNIPTLTARRQALRNNATQPEQILWQRLRNQQLGVKFRRQHGIGNYIVDFYCPQCKLVIELDGESHFTTEAQIYDEIRDAYIRSLGLTILRFTNHDVTQNLEGVYEGIERAIHEHL